MTTQVVKKQYFSAEDVRKALGLKEGTVKAVFSDGYDSKERKFSSIVIETVVDSHRSDRNED